MLPPVIWLDTVKIYMITICITDLNVLCTNVPLDFCHVRAVNKHDFTAVDALFVLLAAVLYVGALAFSLAAVST